jgi:hypothetical protein
MPFDRYDRATEGVARPRVGDATAEFFTLSLRPAVGLVGEPTATIARPGGGRAMPGGACSALIPGKRRFTPEVTRTDAQIRRWPTP